MTSRFCNLCGCPLENQRYVYLRPLGQITVCKSCELRAQRCIVCGTPLAAAGKENRSVEQCPYCFAGQPVCSACGRPVGERGYGRISEYEVFCAFCYYQRERCLTCGRPIVGEVWRLADGRYLCSRCHQSTVVDEREAHLLFDQVIQWVYENLGLRVYRRPILALVEGVELDKLNPAISVPSLQTRDYLLGVFQRRGPERIIWIQRGLPTLVMVKVIAHEYGHAWQAENTPFLRDQLPIEGFCEWISYRILALMDAPFEQRRMRLAEGFYGDALRHILAIEAIDGCAGVISALRTVQPQAYLSNTTNNQRS